MKTLISILTIAVSLISCNNSETKSNSKFKFYHADTNKEFTNASAMINAMQKGKVYRLDLNTGECSQYVKSLTH